MTTKPKGTCPVCNRQYALTGFGRIRSHWARTPEGKAAPGLPECAGTGELPRA
jgi:hypothetical protein